MKKRIFVTLFSLALIAFSSCKAVRKKNKCVSCPTWDQAESIENGFEK